MSEILDEFRGARNRPRDQRRVSQHDAKFGGRRDVIVRVAQVLARESVPLHAGSPENAFLHMVQVLARLHAWLWSVHALLRFRALAHDGCADAALPEQVLTEHVFPASPVPMLVSPFHVFLRAHIRTRAVVS